MKPRKKMAGWTQEQDKLLSTLISTRGRIWSSISYQLQKTYGYKRTGRQCRQRWYNHLNPTISKNQWSPQQEDILFSQHLAYGSKWSRIAEVLQGRSENAIKNHFYSRVRKILRRINKFVGSKDGTTKVKSIKPSTLSKIFTIVQQVQNQKIDDEVRKQQIQYKQSIYKLVQFSRKKLSASSLSISKADVQKFRFLLQQLTKINYIYQIEKSAEVKRNKQKKLQKHFDKFAQTSSDEDSQSEREYYSNKKQINYNIQNKIKSEFTYRSAPTKQIQPVPLKKQQRLPNILAIGNSSVKLQNGCQHTQNHFPLSYYPDNNTKSQHGLLQVKLEQFYQEFNRNMRILFSNFDAEFNFIKKQQIQYQQTQGNSKKLIQDVCIGRQLIKMQQNIQAKKEQQEDMKCIKLQILQQNQKYPGTNNIVKSLI